MWTTARIRRAERILTDVLNQLAHLGRAETDDVHVQVQGDVVSLIGSVPTDEVRKTAVIDAWLVPGVTHIDDRLTVDSVDTARRRTDESPPS